MRACLFLFWMNMAFAFVGGCLNAIIVVPTSLVGCAINLGMGLICMAVLLCESRP